MKNTKKQTAATEAYKKAVKRVNALMTEVQDKLTAHQARQAEQPANWGFEGDMNHFAEVLEELLGREKKFYSTPLGRVTIPE